MIHPLKIKFQKRTLLLGAVFFSLLLPTACLIFFFGRDPDRRFEDYTEALFCQEVAGNTLSLHFTLQDPSSYGIHDAPISLGQVSTDPEEISAAAENALALLHRHDREKLSGENRLTYDILEQYLSNSLRESAYALYEEPLSSLTGTQAQLPVLLSEYRFSNREDVETYLKLLDQVPVYFQSILEFEEARSREGLFMSAQRADAVVEECQVFLDLGEKNYLYSSFRERLKELSLPQDDLEAYCRENAAAVKRSVFPAYQDLMDGILALRDTGKNSGGLCHFPEGETYYEILAAMETGSDRSVPELQALTRQQLARDLLDLQEALAAYSGSGDVSISSDLFKPQGEMLSDTNPASILVYLEEKIEGEFPAPPQVDTRIKYVQESMQEYLSPAFYLIPAILFFGLGKAPAVIATTIYAIVPVIRLTSHGIRQVDPEVVEAARSFGVTRWQLLIKVQIPQALPTIMTGVNQTLMMAMAMVVTCSMIGASGLGMEVLNAVNRIEIGRGIIAGSAVVIVAIIMDRITQGIAHRSEEKRHGK